ncbi:MAG: hypothetical protein PVJ80_06310 [Gemmatimonadota bacterium]
MNWDAIQALAELVAAIGVLVSLVYLAGQIRDNTASLQAGTVSRVAEHWSEFRRAIWSDPETASLYILAVSGDPIDDPVQSIRVRAYWLNVLKDAESVFYQHLAGQLPLDIWHGYRKELRVQLGTPGAQDAVAGWGTLLSEPFYDFVKGEVPLAEGTALQELRETYDRAAMERRTRDSSASGRPRTT